MDHDQCVGFARDSLPERRNLLNPCGPYQDYRTVFVERRERRQFSAVGIMLSLRKIGPSKALPARAKLVSQDREVWTGSLPRLYVSRNWLLPGCSQWLPKRSVKNDQRGKSIRSCGESFRFEGLAVGYQAMAKEVGWLRRGRSVPAQPGAQQKAGHFLEEPPGHATADRSQRL